MVLAIHNTHCYDINSLQMAFLTENAIKFDLNTSQARQGIPIALNVQSILIDQLELWP